MALVVGENSYLTLEEAQDIVENELYPGSPERILWESLDNTGKEIVCKKGTMAINTLEFIGQRLVWDTNLKFPRYIRGEKVLPKEVKIAAVINGLLDKMVVSSEQYGLIRKGVKSMSIGPSSVTLDNNVPLGAKVYDEAKVYIRKYVLSSVPC